MRSVFVLQGICGLKATDNDNALAFTTEAPREEMPPLMTGLSQGICPLLSPANMPQA